MLMITVSVKKRNKKQSDTMQHSTVLWNCNLFKTVSDTNRHDAN